MVSELPLYRRLLFSYHVLPATLGAISLLLAVSTVGCPRPQVVVTISPSSLTLNSLSHF